RGEREGEVDRGRRFSDATLARTDGEDVADLGQRRKRALHRARVDCHGRVITCESLRPVYRALTAPLPPRDIRSSPARGIQGERGALPDPEHRASPADSHAPGLVGYSTVRTVPGALSSRTA